MASSVAVSAHGGAVRVSTSHIGRSSQGTISAAQAREMARALLTIADELDPPASAA